MIQIRVHARAILVALTVFCAPASASSLTVTNLNDSGAGSLRAALASAAAGDTVVLSVTGSIALASPLTVSQDLTIQGPGAASLVLDGQDTVRVIVITGGALTLSGVTIARGRNAGLGGGINISGGGALTVINSIFTGNRGSNGGAIAVGAGTALTVDGTTFDSNTTTGVGGGAIIVSGPTSVRNSTFTGNTAPINGGAINIQGGGVLTMINSTLFNNTSGGLGGSLTLLGRATIINSTFASNHGSSGGAIATGNTNLTIYNNVFMDNVAGALNGSTGTSSHNVFFNNTVAGTADDQAGYGTTDFIVAGSSPLEGLANNGGLTQTMLPVQGEAAICAGSITLLPGGLGLDQRGSPRTTIRGGANCLDAGAVQIQSGPTRFVDRVAILGNASQSTVVNTAFAAPLRVVVIDQGGEPYPGIPVFFDAPTSGASLATTRVSIVTDADGIATLAAKANTVAGAYSVKATARGVPAFFSLTNQAATAGLVAVGGTPQTTDPGAEFGVRLQVSVQDAYGNKIPDVPVTFSSSTTTNAGAVFPLGNTATTNASGEVGVFVRANAASGSYTVTASSGTLSPAMFSLTNAPVSTFVVPSLMAGNATQLGIAWANPTADSVTLTATARGYDGQIIAGSGIENPAQLTVPAHSQISKLATEIFGSAIAGRSGWVALTPSNPTAGGGFFMLLNGSLETVDGGGLAAATSSSLVFPHVTVDTILQVVNSGSRSVNGVTATMFDNNGVALSQAAFDIASYSGWSGRIKDLLPALNNEEGYVVIHPNVLGGARVLSGLASYRTGGDSAVVIAQDATAPTSVGYVTQIASGGGYSSQVRLVNLSSTPEQVQLTLNGTTVQRTVAAHSRLDEAVGEMFNLPLSGVTSTFLTLQTQGGPGVHGFVEISSANGLTLTTAPITALGFGQVDMLFSQVSQGGGFWTGLTLVNPSQTEATATIELYSTSGTKVAATTVTIKPGQHITGLVSDFFPSIPIIVGGSIRLTASQPIFGLEVFGGTVTGPPFMSFVPSAR